MNDEGILVEERNYSMKIFRTPDLKIQIPIVFIFSLLPLVTIFELNIDGFLKSLSVFLIPTILITFLLPIFKNYQEQINFRQSAFIALLTLFIVLILTHFLFFINLTLKTSLIISYAVTLSIRYLIIRSAFISDAWKSLPYSLLQSILALPFIHLYFSLEMFDLGLFSLISLISFLTMFCFIAALNRPYKSNFDISAMDMIRISFQLYVGKQEGKEKIEELFSKNSLESDIDYTVFSFKNKKDEKKGLFIIPRLHPGPFKGVGGANLPEILSKEIEDYKEVFTFHGPSTHILNPIKKEDVTLLSNSILENLKGLEYRDYASIHTVMDSGVKINAQRFGDGVLMTASFSPQPTEDIDGPIGEIIEMKGKEKGVEYVGFVDSHNCIQKGCSEVYYPTKRYSKLIEKSDLAFENIIDKEIGKIRLGLASKKMHEEEKGIGGDGIKVAVFEVNGYKNAYILIDGNNMVKGLRERIQNEISDIVDKSEIATTDSHQVNTLNRDYNPVGLNMRKDKIVNDVKKLVNKAVEDLEIVEVGVFKDVLKDFKVMGPVNTNRLSILSETVYKIAPIAILLTFSAQALATGLVISLL